ALVVFLSGEQAILHIGADVSGLPVSARDAISAAWDEAYGIFADLFTRYGFGEDRARVLGVSALGSLAHYVSHRRRLRHAPLGVDIDPYVEEWSAHWSAFLASAGEEAGQAGQAGQAGLAGQAGRPARGQSDALPEGRRSRHANTPGLLRRSVLLVVAVMSMGGVLASCGGSATTRARNASGTVVASQPQSIVYGIIPPQLPPSSKLPSITRQVSRLAGGKPFLVHLYTNWSQYPATLPALDSEIAAYTSRGFLVDLALRYVPAAGHNGDVEGFARYVAAMVTQFAKDPAVAYLQVTNEANSPFNAAASDGAYKNAVGALVDGIEAGAAAKARTGSHVRLGFNWFSSFGVQADRSWWLSIGRLGGARFASDVSWVGIDLYPGTYIPGSLPAPGSGHLATTAAADVAGAVDNLRTNLMPLAGLGSNVPIGISEIGWATSPPARPLSEQAELVKAFAAGACSVAARDNLQFVQWYKLADTVLPTKASPLAMGLMSAALTPNPGFAAYQAVIHQGCSRR
ncbi:MAG: hypothetical protein ACYCUF_03545, partial [Acidimicrobiales bacterium]